MKIIILLAVFATAAFAAPPAPLAKQSSEKEATILRSEFNNIGVDGYNFNVETSDGFARQETGELKTIGEGKEAKEAVVVRGYYQYVGLDGVTYKVDFVADENGFQPTGAHLPVALK